MASHNVRQPVSVPVDVPREVQNDNNGSGAFYQANGNQIIYHYNYPAQRPLGKSLAEESSLEGAHHEECTSMGVDHGPELEPYRTIIDSLSRICQQVQSFSDYIPSEKDIARVSCKADELVPFVRCVARVIREIGKASRGFLSHTIFVAIEQYAFDCSSALREFRHTLDELDPRQDSSREVDALATRWPSLSQRLHEHLCLCQGKMSRFMGYILASHMLELFGVKNGGLGELITKLPRAWDIHHPSVDTIWVREPAGINWYTIPLRFCETWKDFVTVIHQYCRNGPEMEYIRGGNWAIIRDVDNDIVEQSRFTSIIKPEMRFDIGIVVQLLSAMTHICPQCGHHNDDCEPTANGWIRCSSSECDKQFRLVYNPSPKVPDSKSAEPSASKIEDYHLGILKRLRAFIRKARKRLGIKYRRRPTPFVPQDEGAEDVCEPAGERAGLSHLNTKFHRILANVPHSPRGESATNDVPEAQASHSNGGTTPPPGGSIDTTSPTQEPRTTVPSEVPDAANASSPAAFESGPASLASQGAAATNEQPSASSSDCSTTFSINPQIYPVSLLVTTNRQAFEHLQAFCEDFKAKKKGYSLVVEQASLFNGAITDSIGAAKGMLTMARLSVSDASRTDQVAEALNIARKTIGNFRTVRVSVHIKLQKLAHRVSLRKPSHVDVGEDRLTSVVATLAILEDLIDAVSKLISWWAALEIDISSGQDALKHLAKNPELGGWLHRYWRDIERFCGAYYSQMESQRDYYNDVLESFAPATMFRRVFQFK